VKLLVLDQFSELGGAQCMLLDLLGAIRERGWPAAIGLPAGGPLCDRARALRFEVFPIPCGGYTSGRKSALDVWRFGTEAPRLAIRIRELAAGFEPDLVYINGPRLLPAAALARLQCPMLFHAHIGVSQRAARLLAREALRRIDAEMVAVCQNVADAWQPFTAKPIQVIYNGVAGPEGKRSPNCTGPARVGCIGRIAPEKGQREFLAAATKIHDALPEARFVIAGAALFSDRAARSYEHAVREAAAGMPIEFTGWTNDIYSVLERLDLLLAPSMWEEANPRVILEAFAAAVPVIAFRRGGVPEIIRHGETGFLCDDAGGMAARAIELLRGDRRCLCAVAHAAHEQWRLRFTREHWQQQMIAALERAARIQ
jgi:glycosyltransferase involved in cell wall biosynthesis